MIDIDELKTFAKLPHIFTAKLYREILETIQTYEGYKSYIVSELERYGEDAYKNPDAYTEVKYDVLNLKLPDEPERRLLAIIEQMKKEYANNDKA